MGPFLPRPPWTRTFAQVLTWGCSRLWVEPDSVSLHPEVPGSLGCASLAGTRLCSSPPEGWGGGRRLPAPWTPQRSRGWQGAELVEVPPGRLSRPQHRDLFHASSGMNGAFTLPAQSWILCGSGMEKGCPLGWACGCLHSSRGPRSLSQRPQPGVDRRPQADRAPLTRTATQDELHLTVASVPPSGR